MANENLLKMAEQKFQSAAEKIAKDLIATCYKEPQTNADRIRAMSDEELYIWAKKQIGCGFDFFPCGVVCEGKCESYSDEECKSKIMNWLQQPAE